MCLQHPTVSKSVAFVHRTSYARSPLLREVAVHRGPPALVGRAHALRALRPAGASESVGRGGHPQVRAHYIREPVDKGRFL